MICNKVLTVLLKIPASTISPSTQDDSANRTSKGLQFAECHHSCWDNLPSCQYLSASRCAIWKSFKIDSKFSEFLVWMSLFLSVSGLSENLWGVMIAVWDTTESSWLLSEIPLRGHDCCLRYRWEFMIAVWDTAKRSWLLSEIPLRVHDCCLRYRWEFMIAVWDTAKRSWLLSEIPLRGQDCCLRYRWEFMIAVWDTAGRSWLLSEILLRGHDCCLRYRWYVFSSFSDTAYFQWNFRSCISSVSNITYLASAESEILYCWCLDISDSSALISDSAHMTSVVSDISVSKTLQIVQEIFVTASVMSWTPLICAIFRINPYIGNWSVKEWRV
jgi:hypothetical protein